MKKHFLWMLLALAAAPFAHAQEKLCEPCHHEISPPYSYDHIICISRPVPKWCDTLDANKRGPVIFVVVTYRKVYCSGEAVQLIVDGAVLVDERNYYDSACNEELKPKDCAYPRPLSSADIMALIQEGITAAINSLGVSTSVEVLYPGSCTSLATVAFPKRVFMLRGRGDAGGVDTISIHEGSTIWQTMPCSDVCCKVTYKMHMVQAQNGASEMTWKPESWAGTDDKCESSQLPDYENYRNRIFGISSIAPHDTVYPKVTSQTACNLICEQLHSPPPPGKMDAPRFSTDVTGVKDELRMELEAHPTLFSQYIRFTTNHAISQVMVYDMSGRRVMQQASPAGNELNTAALKNGMYYVQVYLPGNVVKTIKVMKQ